MATQINLPSNVSNKLHEWQLAKQQADFHKAREIELRQQIVDAVLSAEKVEGSETFEIGNGWKLTAKRKLTYNVDSKAIDTLLNLLPEPLADSLVSWKPELKLKGYRDALPAYRMGLTDPEQQKKLNEAVVNAVTIKPAMPELALFEPKGE